MAAPYITPPRLLLGDSSSFVNDMDAGWHEASSNLTF